jgi:TldD protein
VTEPLLPHDVVLAATIGLGLGEVFAESRRHAVVEISGGQVRMARHRYEQGIGIRAATADGCRHVHTAGLDPAVVPELAAAAVHCGPLPGTARRDEAVPPIDVGPAVRLGIDTERDALAAGGPELTEVMVRVVTGEQRVLIGRADHPVAEETRCYAALHVHVTAAKGPLVRRCRRSAGARTVADLTGVPDLARQAAAAALLQLEAVPAPSGELPVVLAPGGPAILLHEACGHALEADLAERPGSAYGGLLGVPVAAPIVSLEDDPGTPADAPLYGVDDEGEPATATVLVARGVLRDHLRDRQQGARSGRPANGHGRRLSYAYPAISRMAGTVVAAGVDDPDDIIRDTGRGLYVRSIGGGDTDMGSGRFNLQVEEGYLIEGGRLGAPIRGAMLSGRGPDVLAAIDRVGFDLAVLGHTYLCRKLDQFPLVVNLGQPTIRVSRLGVWGG